MLRSISSRLLRRSLTSLPHRLSSSTSLGLKQKIVEFEDFEDDGALYGTDYGPGPSRIPYTPPPTWKSGRVPSASIQRSMLSLSEKFGRGAGNPWAYITHIESIFQNAPERLLSCRRSEHHVLLNDLLDYDRPLLAARIMVYIIDSFDHHGSSKREYFKESLVDRVFRRATLPLGETPQRAEVDGTDPRMVARGREDVEVLLQLLSGLESIRHGRTGNVYFWLTQRLVAEGMYDVAAKIFVGWIEEWITEGRIAEGADPDSFYEGGGPPREGRKELELQSDLHRMWWKGIRTWALPGEVLSPHDRLDLWHPRKLKLPEKLRRFPFPVPTSPPSVVHHPEKRTLQLILDNLDLTRYPPDQPPPPSFACSMRACAILASTILSRTIPWLCGDALVTTLFKTPSRPHVYPSNLPSVPENHDEWAYTAYTHVNLALKSLILSPPQPPGLVEYMKAYEEATSDGNRPLPELPLRYEYMTNRIGLWAIVPLTGFALRRLKSVNAVRNLLRYAKKVFVASGHSSLNMINTLYRELSVLKLNQTAQNLENKLFADSALASTAPPLSTMRSPRKPLAVQSKGDLEAGAGAVQQTLEFLQTSMPTGMGMEMEVKSPELVPDGQSFNIMMAHLTATGQHDRFIDNVYRIIPYLQFSTSMRLDEFERIQATVPEEELGYTGRAKPVALNPPTYHVILRGLREQAAVGLAQRVFHLALAAERETEPDPDPEQTGTEHVEARTASANPMDIMTTDDVDDVQIEQGQPTPQKMPIWIFTTMIEIWDDEHRRASSKRQLLDEQWPIGWSTPPGFERLPRHLASMVMIFHTYALARNRWRTQDEGDSVVTSPVSRSGGSGTKAKGIRPDRQFFNAMIKACAVRWGLRHQRDWLIGLGENATPLGEKEAKELKMVVLDMRQWGYDIPVGLLIRLGLKPPLNEEELVRWEGDEAAKLCLLQVVERRETVEDDERLRLNLDEEVEILERMERGEYA